MKEANGLAPGEQIEGEGVSVWTEGDVVHVRYAVLLHGYLGAKRIPLANITKVQWREPSETTAGSLQLVVLGELPTSSFGDFQSQNRLRFETPAREGFARLRDWIEARLSVDRGNSLIWK